MAALGFLYKYRASLASQKNGNGSNTAEWEDSLKTLEDYLHWSYRHVPDFEHGNETVQEFFSKINRAVYALKKSEELAYSILKQMSGQPKTLDARDTKRKVEPSKLRY